MIAKLLHYREIAMRWSGCGLLGNLLGWRILERRRDRLKDERNRAVPAGDRDQLARRRQAAQGSWSRRGTYIANLQSERTSPRISFIALVVIPTVIAAIFYGLLAAPRYVSDVKFIVRSVSTQRATGLDMLFRTFGIAKTVDDAQRHPEIPAIARCFAGRDGRRHRREGDLQRPEADWWSSYPYSGGGTPTSPCSTIFTTM